MKTHKSIIFIILHFFVLNSANSETIKSIRIFNYPVEEIYLINNPISGGISWGSTYEEACKLMGDKFFWGVVLSKSELPACYTQPSFNMIIGADTWFCADGSISYFNVPHSFCNDYISCPDNSWILSKDKSMCTRDETCIPDPTTVSEEKMLAAIAYGESHWSNDYEEMAGIASAVLRRMDAKGYKTINELILNDSNFAYAADAKSKNERYYNVMCNINSNGIDMAYKAAQNALNGGPDYSNGACYWDGVDLKVNGKQAYRYKFGFKILNEEHNVLSVVEPAPFKKKGRNGKFYGYTYISTAGHNKTIFWKLSNEFIAAGGKQCI